MLTGSEVVSVQSDDPSVTLRNGQQIRGDVVIAADGIKSACREILAPDTNQASLSHLRCHFIQLIDSVPAHKLSVCLPLLAARITVHRPASARTLDAAAQSLRRRPFQIGSVSNPARNHCKQRHAVSEGTLQRGGDRLEYP